MESGMGGRRLESRVRCGNGRKVWEADTCSSPEICMAHCFAHSGVAQKLPPQINLPWHTPGLGRQSWTTMGKEHVANTM